MSDIVNGWQMHKFSCSSFQFPDMMMNIAYFCYS